jgi:prevent-host-death family protein
MKRSWQLQEAKARLSEVVKTAAKEGPQEITVRGETAAFLISGQDFARLTKPKPDFVAFMRRSPFAVDLKVTRDRLDRSPGGAVSYLVDTNVVAELAARARLTGDLLVPGRSGCRPSSERADHR